MRKTQSVLEKMALIPFPLYERLVQLLDEDEIHQLNEMNEQNTIFNTDGVVVSDEEVDFTSNVATTGTMSTQAQHLMADLDQSIKAYHDENEARQVTQISATDSANAETVRAWKKSSDDLPTVVAPTVVTPTVVAPTVVAPTVVEVYGDNTKGTMTEQKVFVDKAVQVNLPPLQETEQQQRSEMEFDEVELDEEEVPETLSDNGDAVGNVIAKQPRRMKPPKKLRHSCTSCSSHFSTSAALNIHVNRVHSHPSEDLGEIKSSKKSKVALTQTEYDDQLEEADVNDELEEDVNDHLEEEPDVNDQLEEAPVEHDDTDQLEKAPVEYDDQLDEKPTKKSKLSTVELQTSQAKKQKRTSSPSDSVQTRSKKSKLDTKDRQVLGCTYCKATFKTKGGQTRHAKNIHGLVLSEDEWTMDTESPRNKRKLPSQGGRRATKKTKSLGKKRPADSPLEEIQPSKRKKSSMFKIWSPRK